MSETGFCMAKLFHQHGVSVCLKRGAHEQHGAGCDTCDEYGDDCWLEWDEDGEDWTRTQ